MASTVHRRALVLGWILVVATIGTPALGETLQREEGRLLAAAPLAGVGFNEPVRGVLPYDGVNLATESLLAEASGAEFRLEAVDGTDPGSDGNGDLDVCFYDETESPVACSASPGGESGRVPDGAVEAGVFLYSGVDVHYRLTITSE